MKKEEAMDLKKLILQGSPREIREYISQGESETLEFKESPGEWKEIIETVSAFANSKGGRILVGIANDGSVRGIMIGKDTVEKLANRIKENTDPKIFPEIEVESIEGKTIITIDIKESSEKPVFFKNKAYKRVGKSNHLVSASELRKLAREEKKKLNWDERICEKASLEDIDEEKMRWFLRKAKTERNFNIDPETPTKDALERLNLAIDNKLTNAAILLFGKDPQKLFLQAEVRCARFKGNKPIKPFIDMKAFGRSIIGQLDKALGFVLEHIPMKVYLVGKPEREEKYEYPPDAIREAIVNAICHRDYESRGNIQIRIFNDRIEVWNPGLLPEPLTLEDLKRKHKSIPRNPLIAKCFFLMKFIEQWGTGTNDMVAMCLDWELPEPMFEYVTGDFVVTFRKYHISEDILSTLNERQKKIVDYLREYKKIDRRQCMELLNTSKDTVFRELLVLKEKNIIGSVGKGRSVYYILK